MRLIFGCFSTRQFQQYLCHYLQLQSVNGIAGRARLTSMHPLQSEPVRVDDPGKDGPEECDRTAKLNGLIKCNDHHLNTSGALV